MIWRMYCIYCTVSRVWPHAVWGQLLGRRNILLSLNTVLYMNNDNCNDSIAVAIVISIDSRHDGVAVLFLQFNLTFQHSIFVQIKENSDCSTVSSDMILVRLRQATMAGKAQRCTALSGAQLRKWPLQKSCPFKPHQMPSTTRSRECAAGAPSSAVEPQSPPPGRQPMRRCEEGSMPQINQPWAAGAGLMEPPETGYFAHESLGSWHTERHTFKVTRDNSTSGTCWLVWDAVRPVLRLPGWERWRNLLSLVPARVRDVTAVGLSLRRVCRPARVRNTVECERPTSVVCDSYLRPNQAKSLNALFRSALLLPHIQYGPVLLYTI